jgi:TIR domain
VEIAEMATTKEYFEKNTFLEYGTELMFTYEHQSILVPVKIPRDFEGGSKHIKAYIPEFEEPDELTIVLAENITLVCGKAKDVGIYSGFANTREYISAAELKFSGRLLIYTPTIISSERWDKVKIKLSALGLDLLVRDGTYTEARAKTEKPLAFISHDSWDKESLARTLASELTKMMCPVWYDEYALVPGQSLRESIERGLKECPKCIVVLSKNFFNNQGWTKREFDPIYTREVVEGKRVMIPIWLEVTREEVYDYSPILADTVGIKAVKRVSGEIDVDAIARQLFRVLI